MTPETETQFLKALASIAFSLRELVEAAKDRPSAAIGQGQAPKSAPPSGSGAVVPFGKNKGVALADLADRSLSFYAFKWTPTTSEQYPNPSSRDLAFSNAAKAEAKRRGLLPEAQNEAESTYQAPPLASSPPSLPSNEPKDEEDLPF